MARVSKPPEQRRQELIDTAGKLFAAQGYEETTVSDIVGQVGVAQGLFYYYFRSKKEIFLAVINQLMEARIGELAHFLGDKSTPPIDRVHNLMAQLVGFLGEMESLYPRHSEDVISEMMAITHTHVSGMIEPTVTQLLREWEAEGILPPMMPERLSRFITAGFVGVQNMDDPPRAGEMMDFILFTLERLLDIPKQGGGKEAQNAGTQNRQRK